MENITRAEIEKFMCYWQGRKQGLSNMGILLGDDERGLDMTITHLLTQVNALREALWQAKAQIQVMSFHCENDATESTLALIGKALAQTEHLGKIQGVYG